MVFEKKQLSKALAIALMVACAVAFMPLLNGQAFAAAKKPAKVKSLKAAQVADTMTAKATWKKGKNCKKYNVKVDGVLVAKKQKAKSYTTEALTEGAHKIAVAGVNGKKVGKYKTVTVNIVAPTPPTPTKLEIKEAKQTGAADITITFNKAVEAVPAITVARGTADQKIAATAQSADKTSVVVTLNANLIAADYTVTVTELGSDPLTATVTCAPATLTEAKFLSDKLVLKDNADPKEATVALKGYDQFGGEIENFAPDSITAAGAAAVTAGDYQDSILTLTAAGETKWVLGQQVPVAVVYANNTKVLNQTLTVSAAAYVGELAIGDITTENEKYVGKRLTAKNLAAEDAGYYLPITAKDQYGNALNAAQLREMVGASLFVTPVVVQAGAFNDENDNKEVRIPVSIDGDVYGTTDITGVVNILSTGIGNTSKEIEVKANEKIDTLSVEVPELTIGKPATLTLTAVDQYGDAVDLYKVYKTSGDYSLEFTDGTKVTLSGAKFSVATSTAKKTLTVKITPEQANVLVSVITATYKASSNTYTAAGKAYLNGIAGMDADHAPTTTYVVDSDAFPADGIDLATTNFYDFVDQYGEDIGWTQYRNPVYSAEGLLEGYDGEYDLTVTPPTTLKVTEFDGPSTVTGLKEGKSGSDKYVVSLVYTPVDTGVPATLATIPVTFTVTDAEELTYSMKLTYTNEYGSEIDNPTIHVGEYGYALELVGVTAGGEEVEATGATFVNNPESADDYVTVTNGKDNGSADIMVAGAEEDGTATVEGVAAVGKKTFNVSTDVNYSVAASKGAKAVLQQKIEGKYVDVEAAEFDNPLDTEVKYYVVDQYGAPMDSEIAFSSFVDTDGKKIDRVFPLDANYGDDGVLNFKWTHSYAKLDPADQFDVTLSVKGMNNTATFVYVGDAAATAPVAVARNINAPNIDRTVYDPETTYQIANIVDPSKITITDQYGDPWTGDKWPGEPLTVTYRSGAGGYGNPAVTSADNSSFTTCDTWSGRPSNKTSTLTYRVAIGTVRDDFTIGVQVNRP